MTDENVLIRAYFESKNFSFEAFDRRKELALANLLRGVAIHCQHYDMPPEAMTVLVKEVTEGVEYDTLRLGAVYRDREELKPAETLSLAALEAMGAAARPLDSNEWGSERQIAAQNAFHSACEEAYPDLFNDESDYSAWCLKATTDEMIDEALRLIKERNPT